MGKHTGRWVVAVFAWMVAGMPATAVEGPARPADVYWKLGAGIYGTPTDTNDAAELVSHARFDWQLLCFGNQVRMPVINECLRLNPRQKYLVRLWPLRGNMLGYFYTPGQKEQTLAMISGQIRLVLDNITRPDHVLGFTFAEELPDRWHPFYRLKTDEQVAAVLEPYRSAIEQELGRPMQVDDALRGWFWDKYVESLDQIHAAIRAEGGTNRLVMFWPRYDCFNTNIVDRVVRPGVGADGVFIYVLRIDAYLRLSAYAAERGWPYFSQLSHNTGMKQQGWGALVDLPETKTPYNLGYFFYGGGNPLRPHFFDNPAVNPANNVSGFSTPVHMRWFLGDRNIGWDVLKRAIRFDPLLDLRVTGQTAELHAVIPNPILEGHYPTPEDQGVTNVAVRLILPEGWTIEKGSSVAELGALGASRHRAPAPASIGAVHWRLRIADPDWLGAKTPIRVTVDGVHRQLGRIRGEAVIRDADAHRMPCFQEQRLLVSGQGWMEPAFAVSRDVCPAILLRTAGAPVEKPSVADGEFDVAVSLGSYKDNAGFYRLLPKSPVREGARRIMFNGTLPPHSLLTITGTNAATLCPVRPLLDRTFCTKQNPGAGATGGYYMGAHAIGRPIPEGEKVRIEISGKAEGAVNSHVVVNFVSLDTGEKGGAGVLTRRFGAEWKEGIGVEIEPPFTNATLQSVALYRYPHGATGTVWYGSLKVDLASPPEAAQDVGSKIEGTMPVVRAGACNVFTYFDEDTSQPRGSKIGVKLEVE